MDSSLKWQIAIALHLLFTTSVALLRRSYASKSEESATLSTAVMYLTTILPIGVVWSVFIAGVDFNFPAYIWWFHVLGAVVFAFANLASFAANSRVDAAQFGILENFKTITTIVVSSILLSETLQGTQYTGVALLLAATVIIASLKFDRTTMRIDRYTLLAIISAVLFGAGLTNMKYILDNVTFPTYILIGWVLQALVLGLLANKQLLNTRAVLARKGSGKLMMLGVLRTFSAFAMIYALSQADNSSLISAIVSYKTALVVVGAFIVLRERENMFVKIAGTVVATLGLLLVMR